MIRKINLLLSGSLVCFVSFAQSNHVAGSKAPVTPAQFGKFASVTSAFLSNDGRYAVYNVNDPVGNTGGSYIKSIEGNSLSVKIGYGQFTRNGRYYVYKHSADSLAFLDLKNKQTEFISGVDNYKQAGKQIAYLKKSLSKLVVRNIENKKESTFDNVGDYYFNETRTSLVLVSAVDELPSVQVADLDKNEKKVIWTAAGKDEKAEGFIFSKSGDAIAFVVDTEGRKSIWSYETSVDKAVEVANSRSLIDSTLVIEGIDYRGFARDGKSVFIDVKEKDRPKPQPGVDVWSYMDTRLQSEQLKQLKSKTFVGLISVADKKFTRLEHSGDQMMVQNEDYALVRNCKGDGTYDEWYWNKAITSQVWLVSLRNGSRKLIADNLPAISTLSYWLSPGGKYIIFYNAEDRNYFSYEIASGIQRNITQGISTEWTKYEKRDVAMGKYMPVYSAAAGWLKDDKAVILYSQCDIFLVDPSGKSSPVNLTNGLGKESNIEFRLTIETNRVFNGDEKIYLSAFNRTNKKDGFYQIKLDKDKTPELLTVSDAVYKGTWEDERFAPVYPVKAADAEIYLVRKMTASESPNYFWTKDFKTFRPISDAHPEKDYNWLTTELINWKTPDGKSCQGILYKPQNFDASKRYPIIFHYYERVTEALNVFISPEASHGELNVPYFVSNGYLVFMPDFVYEQGRTGNSVLNTVVSAAQYLSTFSFIDGKHIGLQGHSRGGWETNYIITHTNIFAAAVPAAGMSNYISLYNGARLYRSGISRQTAFEILYQRIGATLWEKPELYIENSPIFRANEVTAPVLMMGNKADDDVPFEQSLEFFTALRRLGKRAWMLQYDEGQHIVFDKSAEDFTIRMKQFFDHYLKGEPAPKWMLYGIPAKDKGIADGLELVKEKDANGNWVTPGPGLPRSSGMK